MEPKKQRKTRPISIRFSADERAALDAAADKMGIGPSSFARISVVRAVALNPAPVPRPKRKPTEASRSLATFIGQIAAIGNNLNQLAHLGNTGFDVDPEAIREVAAELARLREAILTSKDDQSDSDLR